MSSFFTNVHVRTDDTQSVQDALRLKGYLPAYFSQVENGWLSIYPRRTEDLDSEELDPDGDIDELLEKACCFTSSAAMTIACAFVNYDGVFCYWLANSGELLDVFSSDPEQCGKDPQQWSGNTAAFLPFCKAGTRERELEDLVVHRKWRKAPMSSSQEQKVISEIESKKLDLLSKYAKMAQLPPDRVKEAVPDIDDMLNYLERDLRAAYGLSDDLPSPESVLSVLANLLEIPAERVTTGFNYLAEEQVDDSLIFRLVQ